LTDDPTTEAMEAAIIRATYANPSYSHAENILLRLRDLSTRHPHEEVVRILHAEVVGDPG
jgi:hypothetical protein